MFYRTLNGAQVGDLFMSLIHTAELCVANPFDYLTELQRHALELAASPAEVDAVDLPRDASAGQRQPGFRVECDGLDPMEPEPHAESSPSWHLCNLNSGFSQLGSGRRLHMRHGARSGPNRFRVQRCIGTDQAIGQRLSTGLLAGRAPRVCPSGAPVQFYSVLLFLCRGMTSFNCGSMSSMTSRPNWAARCSKALP